MENLVDVSARAKREQPNGNAGDGVVPREAI
jgi:hypothetical protein